ncbi:MAG TPA: HAMP domain-containing sensor histidine kinase [Armatimonadota bacterium]|jgi:signal transduction histidine kinase
MLSSMRTRMTLAFTATAAVLLLLVSGGLVWSARLSAERDADTLLRSAAVQYRAEVGRGGRGEALAELMEEREQRRAQGIAIALYDASGHRVWPSDAHVPPAPGTAKGEWRTAHVLVGSDVALFGVPWEKAERNLEREALALAALSLVVLLGTAGGAWAVVGRTLSPIERLSEQAARTSADAPAVRLSAPSRDAEVVTLVGTLNGFLDRLYEATAARQRFYAAASHELRTPLQALQGHLELALTRKRSAEEYEAAIAEAHEQAGALSRLVQDLLALNRLQSRAGETAAEPVDVAAAVAWSVNTYADLARQRGLSVEITGPESLCVMAPETHVGMIVRNLIENAVKYARNGGKVGISLEDGTIPRLTVENETGSTPPLDARRLFEPFYRPDSARASETGGNGLGLAICKAAADANGWDLSVVHDGAVVTVTASFQGAVHETEKFVR